MASGTRICKICGVEYPYCKTKFVEGVFRYQDVACCPEHGSEYLAKVIASREEPKAKAVEAKAPTATKAKKKTKSTRKTTKQSAAKAEDDAKK